MSKAVHDLYEEIFLRHAALLSETNQDRYCDIIESLKFATDLKIQHKINFEFQNLCDFLDETQYEDMPKVFNYWKEFE